MPTDLLTHLFDIAHSIEGSVTLHIDHEGHRARVTLSKPVNGAHTQLAWTYYPEGDDLFVDPTTSQWTRRDFTVALNMLHRHFLHRLTASPHQ